MAASVREIGIAPLKFKGNMAVNWKEFRSSFIRHIERYTYWLPEEKKIAMLLKAGGDDLCDIYNSLVFKRNERKNLDTVLDKFDAYFIPATNVTYERFLFFNKKQDDDESYAKYMSTLKNMAETCEFGTLSDSLVRDAFVSGIADKSIQKMLLCIKNLSIEEALDICQEYTLITEQLQKIHGKNTEIKPPQKHEVVGTQKIKNNAIKVKPNEIPKSTQIKCQLCKKFHGNDYCPENEKIREKFFNRFPLASVKNWRNELEEEEGSSEEFESDFPDTSSNMMKNAHSSDYLFEAKLEYESRYWKKNVLLKRGNAQPNRPA